nr:hypothetical protein [Tanacetum cinerariifolium]
RTNSDFVHFSDLDTFSSVRRPKNSGVIWKKKGSSNTSNVGLSAICLWIIDSGCSKHMTGNHALLTNFVEKFLGMVRFVNNDFAVIAGYGDVVIGSMTIKKVYYVKVLGHNLFSVGQFCDKGLEVAFRKSTCFVRNEDGVDFLTGYRSSNLYTIALNEVASNSFTCILAKTSSSQSWLWHQRLSHLNFATINNLVKNNLVQEEVILPLSNTQSIPINMVPNADEASTSHNVFNERLKDAYFDASTSFHDPSNVHTYYQPYLHEKKWTKDHPLHKIIGDLKLSVRTRGQLANSCLFSCLLSSIELANVAEALKDADWVSAMQEEIDQFARLKVWRLVPRPEGKSVIKTKWIFKNKKDESSLVIRNKARLVAVDYSQKEGIDYDETFAPGSNRNYTLEEVYVGQPPGFVSKQYPYHVYTLDKALYGLKQAPRAWYDVLSQFLVESGFQKGSIDTTIFIKKKGKRIMLIQIYVDDIIFGSRNQKYCTKFLDLMVNHFEMSMMGEMKFFLGLQVNQYSNGIFINQSKYILDILKRFGMENCDTVPTPMVE